MVGTVGRKPRVLVLIKERGRRSSQASFSTSHYHPSPNEKGVARTATILYWETTNLTSRFKAANAAMWVAELPQFSLIISIETPKTFDC
jgi:hypothetical protein